MSDINLINQHRKQVQEFNRAVAEYIHTKGNAERQLEYEESSAQSELDQIHAKADRLLKDLQEICGDLVSPSLIHDGSESILVTGEGSQQLGVDPFDKLQQCIVDAEKVYTQAKHIASKPSLLASSAKNFGTFVEGAAEGAGRSSCTTCFVTILITVAPISYAIGSLIVGEDNIGTALAVGFTILMVIVLGINSLINRFRATDLDENIRNLRKVASEAGYWHRQCIEPAQQNCQHLIDAARNRYYQSLENAKASLEQQTSYFQDSFNEFAKQALPYSYQWSDTYWQQWSPAITDTQITRLGDMYSIHPISQDRFSLPILLHLPGTRSLLLQLTSMSKSEGVNSIQALLIRLIATIPPAKVEFTFLDPVGLGQNVAPFITLADHSEDLVNSKAWSEPQHIEKRLAELTEHMETVIQKYLRGQYATIEDYNVEAGEVAEPYQIVVIFDFPVNFSEDSTRRLMSIVENGPRCGVYAIILMDMEKPLPHGFNISELEQAATVIAWNEDRFVWKDDDYKEWMLDLDIPPNQTLFDRILQMVGEQAVIASKVEVPFGRIAPVQKQWWLQQTSNGLLIPLGPSGARKVQNLELGQGTAQHALVVGKTGSGKSTLLHILVTSTILTYSPEEIELYLIDFKKGVEFKTYATHRLPHARVIAIESEREFGISVLQGLDLELKRRGDIYRSAGVDNITNYRQKNDQRMPRILLLVDEFQEFFTEDDAIASQAAQILDRLVRQGRAFGIHVLLGSQTLAGAYNLARSTIDQMAVRVALQCSEADARLIMADDNPAARLLSRPGEAIYNAANGLIEGNNNFQVAWLSDGERDHYLDQVQTIATEQNYQLPQIIFEGNVSADVEKNQLLHEILTSPDSESTYKGFSAWLGEPIAIRDPLAAIFHRQSGSNLLIVGQKDEDAIGMMVTTIISLAAQLPVATKNDLPLFSVIDFSPADTTYAHIFQELSTQIVHPTTMGKRRHLPDMINQIVTEVQRRLEEEEAASPMFLFIYGLQRARDLREEEVFSMSFDDSSPPSPAKQLKTILQEGPDVGIHTIIWCDTVANLNRSLDRRVLREFAMRVAFQMGAEDSANFIDTPAASKIGQHRALFQNEEEGVLEKFRPYSVPSKDWLSWAYDQLKHRPNTK